MLCSYGCGQEAIHKFKYGGWCCSLSVNKCPSMRKKNSDGIQKSLPTRKPSSRLGSKNKKPLPTKGKTLDQIVGLERSIEIRDKISKAVQNRERCGYAATPEAELLRKKKISETMLRNKRCGGYRPGSGIGKSGWYKNFWCDSSYELAWVIYQLEHNIEFERNKIGFEYIHNGLKFKYYPDFKIQNVYYEMKGYITEKDKSKFQYFPHELNIIDSEKIKPYIDYVISKYGKDFINLYEKQGSVAELV